MDSDHIIYSIIHFIGTYIFDLVGCIGALCVLIAYGLLQAKRMEASSLKYILLNIAGALFILISLLDSWNLAAFLIELAWIVISVMGLCEWYSARKLHKAATS